MCAANPRSRKATISSFFKSLALRFSFSVCCRTCLRLLLREGLVVLKVASVTLYEAGDADILSRGGMFFTTRGGERMALFCSEKCLKNSLCSSCCAFFAFFYRFLFFESDVCVCSFTWPADICCFVRKNALNHLLILTHRPKDASNILSKVSPHNQSRICISSSQRYQTYEKSFDAFQRESLGALLNNNNSFFIVSVFFKSF